MAFCKRCGDIIHSERCRKCGGTAVAATLRWNQSASNPAPSNAPPVPSGDKWSKSFLERSSVFESRSTPKPSEVRAAQTVSARPAVNDALPEIGSPTPSTTTTIAHRGSFSSAKLSPETMRTSASQPPRTPSPFKSISRYLNPDSPDPTIILNMDGAASGGSLAKVYGTVLQPTETLSSFVCAGCDQTFPPDATIYPSLTNAREFFCRPCFEENGGIRGLCQSCNREVYRLKAEGGFVENSGRVWHTKCFRCEGCGREIGTRPMVDVLGRPCCDDCFDDCLKRGRNGSAKSSRNPSPASKAVGMVGPPKSPAGLAEATLSPPGNPGGLRKSASQPGISETHPVVEELARRIGSSPARKDTRDLSPAPRVTPRRDNSNNNSIAVDSAGSPFQRSVTERPAPSTNDAAPSHGSSPTKRFAAVDFGAAPQGSSTKLPATNSLVSSSSASTPTSTLGFATSSPRSRSRSPAIPGSRDVPETPAPITTKTVTAAASTPTRLAKPRDSLSSSGNRTASGLLTPGPTPTQSPMGTPPSRVINIASPPGSASRIPSLRARHSIASISSPPPSSSPGTRSSNAANNNNVNTPNASQIGATPSRQTGGVTKQETPSRIPSVSSPRVLPSSSLANSVPSPKSSTQTLNKATQYKSSLATIAASPSSSPAATVAVKDKPKRPSVTIPLGGEEEGGEDDSRCEGCQEPLYGMKFDGRIITVPVPEGQRLRRYHPECFRCDACGESFAEVDGAASFVRYEGGVRHLECTPTKHIRTIKHPAYEPITQLRDVNTVPLKPAQSERGAKPLPRPASMYASTTGIPRPNFASHQAIDSMSSSGSSAGVGSRIPSSATAPRFGSATVCPGCRVSVSPMERGIVPGPAATKWHAPCLVCGGREHSRRVSTAWMTRDEVKGPGCRKKLDSAAKGDLALGVLWCRDCWDLMRAQAGSPGSALSPTQSSSNSIPIFPSSLSRPGSSMGSNSNVVEMGVTTLARQMNRTTSASPVRRPFAFPATGSTGGAISDQRGVTQEREPASQYLGGRISPLKNQDTGTGNRRGSGGSGSVRPQYAGVFGQQASRSVSPVKRQYTGMTASSPSVGPEVEAQPLAIQYTGGGVPVTRQLTTSRRPKSALGTRGFMSQKSIDEGRGMFLVRQMTGQASTGDEEN